MENLIIENKQLIEKFKNELTQSKYLNVLEDKKIYYHGTLSALNTLENMIYILEYYVTNLSRDISGKGETLAEVFGLFQALFVSIDSLYSLSRSITKRKWSINLNANEYLREVKYIRNDVVGHPSYRVYNKTDIGFCELDVNDVTIKELKYTTYTVNKNKVEKLQKTVDIEEIIYHYFDQANISLQQIYSRLILEENIATKSIHTSLTDNSFELFKKYKAGEDILYLIESIKESYNNYLGFNNKSNDRLVWRCDLIKMSINWKEEASKRQDLIRYFSLSQIDKLHQMCIAFDKKENVKYTKGSLANINTPTYLKYFYNFMDQNLDLIPYLEQLHDKGHPLALNSARTILTRASDLNNEIVVDLVGWLIILYVSTDKESGSRAYLIGSALKRFAKMHNNQ